MQADVYLTPSDIDTVFSRVLSLTAGGGDTSMSVESEWAGNLRWARNAVTTSGDIRDHLVTVTRNIRGAVGVAQTNKLDDSSLTIALRAAERSLRYATEFPDGPRPLKQQSYLAPVIWSDVTLQLDARARSEAACALLPDILERQLQSAGYVQVGVVARGVRNTNGLSAYYKTTKAQYSITVRNSAGTGSGWGGGSHYDWTRIDTTALTARAVQKCIDSANPKALEPGRYTVVFEPQAVYDLVAPAVRMLDRRAAEQGRSPYMLHGGQSKIGLQIFDERITIRSNPMDREGGYLPLTTEGEPYADTVWVDRGVLKVLAYDRRYGYEQLGVSNPCPNPLAFRIDDGPTSIEEMISTTERGLLMTRLSGVVVLDVVSMMTDAITRDGLWLIERGKITRAIQNFRITDSPMFALNNLIQIGKGIRVFSPEPAIIPPMKVADFQCAALVDAV